MRGYGRCGRRWGCRPRRSAGRAANTRDARVDAQPTRRRATLASGARRGEHNDMHREDLTVKRGDGSRSTRRARGLGLLSGPVDDARFGGMFGHQFLNCAHQHFGRHRLDQVAIEAGFGGALQIGWLAPSG